MIYIYIFEKLLFLLCDLRYGLIVQCVNNDLSGRAPVVMKRTGILIVALRNSQRTFLGKLQAINGFNDAD